MLARFSLVLTSLIAVQVAAVIQLPPTSINVTDSILSSNISTLHDELPDDQFHVSTSLGKMLVPPGPTLMNVLYFMAEIAYGDYNAIIPPNKWSAPGHPGVEVITTSPIEAKYLLSGIFKGIKYMIENNRFNEVQFYLRWDKRMVGQIWIMLPEPSQLRPPSDITAPNLVVKRTDISTPAVYNLTDNNASLSNPVQMDNKNSLGTDVEMSIGTIEGGRPLNRFYVFLVCYEALLHIGPFPVDDYMTDFTAKSPVDDVYMHLLHWGPGIRYFRVIQAMTYIPLRMMRTAEGFREARIRVWEEGALVLEATIKKILPQGSLDTS